MPNIRLHHFHGGLHPEEHKSISNATPIQELALPKQVILPLKQHIGDSNELLVKEGDYVKKGQVLAASKAMISAPIHASTSGTISAIKPHQVPHASGMTAPCIIIDVDFKDAAIASAQTNFDPNELDSESLLELIKQAGVVGLGGAAFPTAAKIGSTSFDKIETLIINGAECEPFITCDDMLMQHHADEVTKGIAWIQKITQPKQTLIGIENNKQLAIDAMQQAVTAASLQNTNVCSIPTLYPSGGEKQLITLLTGAEVPSQKKAFDVGVICQNVGTCAAISHALDNGQVMTSRLITVTGKGVKNPGNFNVRLGTPIAQLIKAAGGYSEDASQLIIGGPMMGFTLPNDQIPVIKATNSILVLNEKFNPNQASQACIRCAKCAEVCPVQLLPQQLYWYSRASEFERITDYHLFDCIECGCCAAVCPSQIPLVQYYRYAKGQIRIDNFEKKKSEHARHRFEFREHRLEEAKLALEEVRRKKREALAAKKKDVKTPAEDAKPDPIQAALDRVKAKQETNNIIKKNTENLTPAQQRQIDDADKRRSKS
ncbi:MAG: electron transport complex subunit RsxC [Gammaproteobacteria bacterium]|nr:electron transport complex subunit RsxC [Gammaproteobacteria bacterium]